MNPTQDHATFITGYNPRTPIVNGDQRDFTQGLYCGLPPQKVLESLLPRVRIAEYKGIRILPTGVYIQAIPAAIGLKHSPRQLENVRFFRAHLHDPTKQELSQIAHTLEHQIASSDRHKDPNDYQAIFGALGHPKTPEEILNLMRQDPIELPGGVLRT